MATAIVYHLESDTDSANHDNTRQNVQPQVEGGPNIHQEKSAKTKPTGSGINITTYESLSAASKERTLSLKKTSWQPKWNRIGPLLGLAALTLTILSIPIAFAILRISDQKPVDSWKYAPSVYLAIMTSITGKATSLAALQGAVITWWLRAIRGSTFEQLHRDWQMGQNIWDALIAGRRMNVIALACVCAAIAAIDAPLLQRASSIVSTVPDSPVKLNVNLTPQLPAYYSGKAMYTVEPLSAGDLFFETMADFDPLINQWIKQEPIPGIVDGCSDSCSVTVRAPMLEKWSCTTKSKYVNFTAPLPGQDSASTSQFSKEVQLNRTGFRVASSIDPSGFPNIEREFLAVVTQISDEQAALTCAGNVTTTYCLLASAIGEYDLIVRNNETRYAGDGLPKPRFVAWSNNTAVTPETNTRFNISGASLNQTADFQNKYNTTFAGLSYAALTKFNKRIYYTPLEWPNRPSFYGMDDWIYTYLKDTNYTCLSAWDDPFDDVITSLNDIVFRTGVHVSRPDFRQDLTSETYLHLDPGVADMISYTTEGVDISRINVFKVDYLFFWGASLVEIICVGVIMYTYYGWWRLGRAVSFSPLELAKAFQAPMFMGINSNANADNIAKEFGARKLRYGIVGMEADGLAFADAETVQKPVHNAIFYR